MTKTSPQATIEVRLSPSSPSISLKDGSEFRLVVELRLVSSVRPGQSITICTTDTALEKKKPGEGIDTMGLGRISGLYWTDEDDSSKPGEARFISLGSFKVHPGTPAIQSDDLRELGYKFVTLPGDGSPVTVSHRLDWDRIFKFSKDVKDQMKPGQQLRAKLTPTRCLNISWWSWGDLEGGLKGKRFHQWTPADLTHAKPDDEFVKEGNWVLGENQFKVKFDDVSEDGGAVFKVAE